MTDYQARNLLVTGSAGFIGANFVRFILQNQPSVRVINLDLLTYAGSEDNLKNLPNMSQYHFIKGDIVDAELVTKIMRDNTIDTVVHFAAESHVDRSIADPGIFVKTNVTGTLTLLEAARNYWLHEQKFSAHECRFHHISTDEVYGSLTATDPPFTETTPYAPNSPYSASKAASDHLVRAYFHTYGLPVTTSHCSNNYGPYQHTEKLIPKVIMRCLSGQPITIYGDGTQIRDWLYVEDHCKAIVAILARGRLGETYNIGGCNEQTNLAIVKMICQRLDILRPQANSYTNLIQFGADRPGHDWRYAIDIKKISRELQWQPQESFASGLEKTLQYYLDQV